MPFKIKQMPRLVTSAAAFSTTILTRTLRVQADDTTGFRQQPQRPAIVAVWHNRMLCLPALFPREFRKHTVVLVSRSRDGGYISDFLSHYGIRTVRGSSSRGGVAAVRQLQQLADDGAIVVLTPDGPRGPKYEVKPGVCWLAAHAGIPVVPISVNARSRWTLRGWDGTQVPKPLARTELLIHQPLHLTAADDGELQAATAQLQAALMSITVD